MFTRLGDAIDKLTVWIGERIMWLSTILVLLIFGDVLLRYLFSTSKAWITDLEWHLFAMLFLIGASYTFKEDQHVRVDVLYSKWNEKKKRTVNLFGTILFLVPWCLIIIYTSFQYSEHAFAVNERSAEPGGLPGRFFIKSMITLGFALLLLQGIASLGRSPRHTENKPAETL